MNSVIRRSEKNVTFHYWLFSLPELSQNTGIELAKENLDRKTRGVMKVVPDFGADIIQKPMDAFGMGGKSRCSSPVRCGQPDGL